MEAENDLWAVCYKSSRVSPQNTSGDEPMNATLCAHAPVHLAFVSSLHITECSGFWIQAQVKHHKSSAEHHAYVAQRTFRLLFSRYRGSKLLYQQSSSVCSSPFNTISCAILSPCLLFSKWSGSIANTATCGMAVPICMGIFSTMQYI